jgi:hypothetical protein
MDTSKVEGSGRPVEEKQKSRLVQNQFKLRGHGGDRLAPAETVPIKGSRGPKLSILHTY